MKKTKKPLKTGSRTPKPRKPETQTGTRNPFYYPPYVVISIPEEKPDSRGFRAAPDSNREALALSGYDSYRRGLYSLEALPVVLLGLRSGLLLLLPEPSSYRAATVPW